MRCFSGAALCIALAAMFVLGSNAEGACTWGDISSLTLPKATALRSSHDLLQNPVRIANDAVGNLYIADAVAGSIVVKDAYGRLVSVKRDLKGPLALAVDASGAIYVGEEVTGSVSVFARDWTLLFKLGKGDGEFLLPNHISIDNSRQLIYVADSYADEVKVFSGPMLVRSFGGKGVAEGQFDFPTGIFAAATGEVFVADQNNDRVQVFDSQGSFLRCFGGSAFSRRFGRIQGVTGDSSGRVYVADAFQGWIQVFDAQGASLGTIGSFGDGTGQLQLPSALAIDRFNRLFVASPGNGRLEVFGLDAFTDPSVLSAEVKAWPSSFARLNVSKNRTMDIYIEITGHKVTEIVPGTVTANGVPADLRSVGIGDRDKDGIQDLGLRFNLMRVLTTLPDGPGVVTVRGALSDGTPFEGSANVRVVAAGHAK